MATTIKPFCWILNRSEYAFPVDIEDDLTVGHLKDAILKKKPNALRNVDADELALWKVPVSFSEEDEIDDEKLKNKRRKEKPLRSRAVLSDLFSQPSDVPGSYIIVELPLSGESPYKKPRLVGPEWNQLWSTFWGKLAPEWTVERYVRIPDERTLDTADDETKYQYLTLPEDGLFPCDLRRILITGTYTSLYRKLCQQDNLYIETAQPEPLISLSHSTIITGQPGTGKTAFLSCLLVWRLQQEKPTVYCSDSVYAYVFTDSGVQRVTLERGEHIEALDQSIHCCGLVDINSKLLDVPSQFHPSRKRLGRVVVATSPNPNHVNAFKQNHAQTYYTPTWKWADLYCASLLLGKPLATESLCDLYVKLGGIPRRCFRALYDNGEEHEIQEIQNAIDQIKDIKLLAQWATGPMPFKNDVSHLLVRTEPKDDRWTEQVTNLLSNYVAELVYERISLHNTVEIRDSIDYLLRIPKARSWAGKLFEMGVHRAFREDFTFEPKAMDVGAPALSVEIRKAKSEAYGYFHTLSVRAKARSRNVDGGVLHQYLIPLSSTAETIDAVYISKSVTVLIQITVSPVHDLNLKGITELTSELPFNAKNRICILFVVPEHETTVSDYKRQTIVVPDGIPDDMMNTVVGYKQYVYYFPMGKL